MIDELTNVETPDATVPTVEARLLNAAAFPIEALPPAARELVEDMSASYKIPVGLPAATLLGVASCAIGKGLVTRAYIDALVPANLYMILGASTGAGKTLAFKPLMKALMDVQSYAQRLYEHYHYPASETEWLEESHFENELGDCDEEAGPATNEPSQHSVISVGCQFFAKHRNFDDKKPQAPVLYSEDMTAPAMAYMLWENRECLSSVSADAFDLVGKLAGKSAEQHAGIQGFYLKCYSEDSIGVGRVVRKIHLIQPNLAVLWLTQLDPLDKFATSDQMRDSGLVARCLLGRFDFQKSPLDGNLGRVDEALLANWHQLALNLMGTYRFGEQRHVVTCSPEAVNSLRGFSNEILALQQGRLADVDSHLVRVAENAVRIALVLHAITHGSSAHEHPISPETAQAAIRLSRWFMAQRLDLLVVKREQSQQQEEEEVVNRLQKSPPRGQTVRWFLQRRIAPSKAGVEAILQRMVAKGAVVAVLKRPKRGGHPVTYYTLPLGSISRPGLPLEADEMATAE